MNQNGDNPTTDPASIAQVRACLDLIFARRRNDLAAVGQAIAELSHYGLYVFLGPQAQRFAGPFTTPAETCHRGGIDSLVRGIERSRLEVGK